jgi:hypothetical protein
MLCLLPQVLVQVEKMLHRKNFTWLLIALFVFLIVVPLVDDFELVSARIMRAAMFSWLMVVGVWSLRGFGHFFIIGIGLVVAGVILSLLAVVINSDSYFYLSFASIMGFALVAIWCIASQILRGQKISFNRIVGAISLYLLLGVTWSMAYALVEKLLPGSFSGITEQGISIWTSEWLYFSYVTLTTLGYGDILPLSATARTLAFMEAVVGQFYIAILVAGLVAAYISERKSS